MIYAKIYYLENPSTKEPFYVGCTGSILEERLYGHISNTAAVKELVISGIVPTIELIEEVHGSISGFTEAYWIDQFRAWGFNLVNCRSAATSNISPYLSVTSPEQLAVEEIRMLAYRETERFKIRCDYKREILNNRIRKIQNGIKIKGRSKAS